MITSNYQVDGDIYSYADKFFCDSNDDKPSNSDAPGGLINGAILEETDTGKTYIFDKKSNEWTEKSAGGGGGGGGSTTLSDLTDVDISNPSNGQTLVYDTASSKWVNGSGGGSSAVLRVVANYDDQTQTTTLSETWKTIYDAVSNGVLAFVAFTEPSEDAGAPDTKYVDIITEVLVSGGVYFVMLGNIAYGTLTQDGYPEAPVPTP